MENKQVICAKLCEVLEETRALFDLSDLIYTKEENGDEFVIALR